MQTISIRKTDSHRRNSSFYDGEDAGITRKINGGIDYLADNALHTWEAPGNVDASYNDNRNTIITNAVNFLQTADNYDFSNRDMRERRFLSVNFP